jgi:hypothetical protein
MDGRDTARKTRSQMTKLDCLAAREPRKETQEPGTRCWFWQPPNPPKWMQLHGPVDKKGKHHHCAAPRLDTPRATTLPIGQTNSGTATLKKPKAERGASSIVPQHSANSVLLCANKTVPCVFGGLDFSTLGKASIPSRGAHTERAPVTHFTVPSPKRRKNILPKVRFQNPRSAFVAHFRVHRETTFCPLARSRSSLVH